MPDTNTPPTPEPPRGMASIYQIRKLEASRPKPEIKFEYTMKGPIAKKVTTKEMIRTNADIDRTVERMREQLRARLNQARPDFTRAHDHGMGR